MVTAAATVPFINVKLRFFARKRDCFLTGEGFEAAHVLK
jgi:hypothetical protein